MTISVSSSNPALTALENLANAQTGAAALTDKSDYHLYHSRRRMP